jgi:hypothetical protein
MTIIHHSGTQISTNQRNMGTIWNIYCIILKKVNQRDEQEEDKNKRIKRLIWVKHDMFI